MGAGGILEGFGELGQVFGVDHHGAAAESRAVVVAEAEGEGTVVEFQELDSGLVVRRFGADFFDDVACAPVHFEGPGENPSAKGWHGVDLARCVA